jgi:hypothetical protein
MDRGLVLIFKRRDTKLLSVLLAGLWIAAFPAQAQRDGQGGRGAQPPAGTAQAEAPFDVTGYWASVITQNWRLRMVTPARGDYIGIPLNVEAKKVADAWDPAKDETAGNQCKGYTAASIMMNPEHLHVSWQDANTLRMDIDEGSQTRLFHFGSWKSPGGAPGWQGDSVAEWSARTSLSEASSPAARGLKVITTNLKPGYLRKNGVPFSAKATLTEYFDVFTEPDGDTLLIVTSEVRDPVYLDNPWIVTAQFKRRADASGWDPTPCSSRW